MDVTLKDRPIIYILQNKVWFFFRWILQECVTVMSTLQKGRSQAIHCQELWVSPSDEKAVYTVLDAKVFGLTNVAAACTTNINR